jgi:hypothetical protein
MRWHWNAKDLAIVRLRIRQTNGKVSKTKRTVRGAGTEIESMRSLMVRPSRLAKSQENHFWTVKDNDQNRNEMLSNSMLGWHREADTLRNVLLRKLWSFHIWNWFGCSLMERKIWSDTSRSYLCVVDRWTHKKLNTECDFKGLRLWCWLHLGPAGLRNVSKLNPIH